VAYLDLAGFKLKTAMPDEDVDAVEASKTGYVESLLAEWQSRMDSVLRKRYAVPFVTPVPEVVKGWLARLVTPFVYRRRGVNPSDSQIEDIKEDAKAAWDEIMQAANSETGLYDLPLAENQQSSAVVYGGPLGYAEVSPWRWTEIQREETEDGQP
jgi:hypothetical protein